MGNKKRKLPYSKTLKPNIRTLKVYCDSDAWYWAERSANAFGNAVVLPYGERFSKYEWPVKGRGVVVFDFEGKRTEHIEFLQELLRSGAQDVKIIDADYSGGLYGERRQT